MKLMPALGSAIFVILLHGCGSSDRNSVASGAAPGEYRHDPACAATNLKHWAYANLKDYYLFYDQVPTVNPDSYASATELVEALRVQPYDRFSRVALTNEEDEVFVEGQTFGVGVIWQWSPRDNLTVGGVYADSPMGRAGVTRGDWLVSINDTPVENLTSATYEKIIGTRATAQASTWIFRDGETGLPATYQITPAVFDINTVLHSEIFTYRHFPDPIGYLVLDRFLGTTENELDQVVAEFSQGQVSELILDLRYNGGGLVYAAAKLASQILGPDAAGEMLMEFRHNDKYTEFDFSVDFEALDAHLDLNRLIVLTTDQTASASEMLINALSPYIEVVVMGGRTTGKPYISFGNDFCGLRLHALQAEGFNASDVSVYGGITPTCYAADYMVRDFGYVDNDVGRESMLDSAIKYLSSGTCVAPVLNDPLILNDATNGQQGNTPFSTYATMGGALADGLPGK